MLADPLIPAPADPSEPEPKPKRNARIRCDFCECELAGDGGVLKTSEKAKKLERADKEIADLQGRLDTANQKAEDLQGKLNAMEKPPEPSPKPNGGEKKGKSGWQW